MTGTRPVTSAGTDRPSPRPRKPGWEQRLRRYRRLSGDPYRHRDYTLTALRECDIEKLRHWRNAQQAVLRQRHPIGVEAQRRYYRDVVVPGFGALAPPQILLSLLHRDRCCGYTGLTNLDWRSRRAEISFLIDPERSSRPDQYALDFSSCLLMIKAIAFGELGLNRLFTETYDLRPHHVAVLESRGFVFEGRLRQHVMIDGAPVDSLFHAALREDWCVGT